MVDRHREEDILETAVLVEIEKLRREGLGAMRQKYREVFGEEDPDAAIASICSGASPGGCRPWPRGI